MRPGAFMVAGAVAALALGNHVDRLPPAALPQPPRIERRNDDGLDRRTRKRIEEKARRRRMNERNRKANHSQRQAARNAEFQAAVNQMTGWQRKKWAGAGYPGLQAKDVAAVEPFARLVRL